MKIDKQALIEKAKEVTAQLERKRQADKKDDDAKDALAKNKFSAAVSHAMHNAASAGKRYCEVSVNGLDRDRIVTPVVLELLQEFKTSFDGDGYTDTVLVIDWRD